MIRVGRRVYRGGSYTDPCYDDFKSILCLTPSTPYGELGPYVLKDDHGRIMENIWQFSKVYREVPRSLQRYSRYDDRIIWDHPKEIHYDEKSDEITSLYLDWRQKGMYNTYPVRYPVGYKNKNKCLFSLKEKCYGDPYSVDITEKLNYIEARKQIYVPIYCDIVKKQKKFKSLKRKLSKGRNLLIIEVDGPHQESLQYYKDEYKVDDDFIENNTILINEENINILLDDERRPFGHGYCLAIALLDKDIEWNNYEFMTGY
jgi:hypothetical protein